MPVSNRSISAVGYVPRSTRRRASVHSRVRQSDYKIISDRYSLDLVDILPQPSKTPDTFLHDLCRHCIEFVDATAAFLSLLSDKEVALCVKFLWVDEETSRPLLHTLFRSTDTRQVREAYAPKDYFDYFENTAFKELLENWPGKTHFASNNLLMDAANGTYINSHVGWRSFYSSTAVVTIPFGEDGEAKPIGFLCSDSKLAWLNDQTVIRVLHIASRHMYDVLGALFPQAADIEGGSVVGCGWMPGFDGTLRPVDPVHQRSFQEGLRTLEHIYRTEFNGGAVGASPSTPGSSQSPHFLEDDAMHPTDDEMIALARDSDSPAAKQWLEEIGQPEISDEEADSILTEIAAYNPEAERLLKKRRKK